MYQLLCKTDDELYNYYQQIKEGVYKELDKIYLKMIKKFFGCA